MAAITLPCGKSLEKLLKHTGLDPLDVPCVSVTDKQHNCRLIAIRTPAPQAARSACLQEN